ncbi:MAG: hypothetical protein ABL891_23915, partial [Burkholderiales bacterium]
MIHVNEAPGLVLSENEARALGTRALGRIGFSAEEGGVISESLLDAELCGYPALGLARILTISEHVNFKNPRTPIRIEHETPVSARMDGGNYP